MRARHHTLRQTVRLLVAATVLLAGCTTLPMSGLVGASLPAVRYVSPTGHGNGTSWADAAPIANLTALIRALPPGGEVWVRGDQGPYYVRRPIAVSAGGTAAQPIVVRGVDGAGRASATPVLIGNRALPYSPVATHGRPLFGVTKGASHLQFTNLAFQNYGNGVFVFIDPVTDVKIDHVRASNVRRFIEDRATIDHLTVAQVNITGYSKDAIRLAANTHDVLLQDVVGDSAGQDGDNFAMGVHLIGTVHDVVLRRVTMAHNIDTLTTYHNGDGFTAERGTYRLRFEDTNSFGNMDAGYDLKSSDTVLVRARASANKRNFRLWGTNVLAQDIVGETPVKRGGQGIQSQIWVAAGGRVQVVRGTLRDTDPHTVVFDLESTAQLTADRTSVRHASSGRLSNVGTGARLTLR